MEKYLDLHEKLYKTTFTQDEDSLTIDFENNSQIKCIKQTRKVLEVQEVKIFK